MIFLTLGDRIFIMELARGSFQDENSVPSCKKYHSLAHASTNLYINVVINHNIPDDVSSVSDRLDIQAPISMCYMMGHTRDLYTSSNQ